jgi:hypothetical protein
MFLQNPTADVVFIIQHLIKTWTRKKVKREGDSWNGIGILIENNKQLISFEILKFLFISLELLLSALVKKGSDG